MNIKQKIRNILSNRKSPVVDFVLQHADKIDKKEKALLNGVITKAGMDGNGRFEKIDHALSKLHEILAKQGLEIDDVMNAHRFMGDSGRDTFDLARKTEDPQSPLPIKNSKLAFSWHKISDYKYEILAYLS